MITLTEQAVKEIKRTIEELNDNEAFLRVSVKGGGCSGFMTSLAIDSLTSDKDKVYEISGVKIVVDNRSAMYLTGASIDFHSDINNRGFVVNNPGSKSTCGCGKSFSM